MSKMIFLIVLCMVIFPFYLWGQMGIELSSSSRKGDQYVSPELNTLSEFDPVIPRDTRALLIGNQNYDEQPEGWELAFVYEDLKLMEKLLEVCCKVEAENITVLKDISYSGFQTKFNNFLNSLNPRSRVIIYFSGYGRNDGALIFSDGKALAPNELKFLINTISNDTILMLDSSYAKEMENTPGEKFRSNTLRLYASLMDPEAKEVQYTYPFFKDLFPFYKKTLELKELKGNGYFTALMGVFFARYKWKDDQNISFHDLTCYIRNLGKDYLDYLDDRGDSGEHLIRAKQLPQIQPPLDDEVDFKWKENMYVLLQNKMTPIRWEKNFLSINLQTTIGSVLLLEEDSLFGLDSLRVALCYNLNFQEIGFIALGLGGGFFDLREDISYGVPYFPDQENLDRIWALNGYFQYKTDPGLYNAFYTVKCAIGAAFPDLPGGGTKAHLFGSASFGPGLLLKLQHSLFMGINYTYIQSSENFKGNNQISICLNYSYGFLFQ